MKIIVCMKQVPAGNVEVDPENGTLKRAGAETTTNPYDLFALECALRLREQFGGSVTVLTMGPNQAETMVRDAFACGADAGVILSDKKFAGSDVLATSYTLSQGIRLLGDFDLILCGKQTTDGDTAQIGPAIAEHLGIPHCAWVSEIISATSTEITVRQQLGHAIQTSSIAYPTLLTVEKDIVVPRLPSYLRMKDTAEKEIRYLSFADLPDQDLSRYGLVGSPTSVERIFAPEPKGESTEISGTPAQKAAGILNLLRKERLL